MKKLGYIILLSLISLLNCEDVIDIDAPNEEPRLIFEAILRFNLETPQENRIRVSTTGAFFDDVEPLLIERIQLQNIDQGGVGFYAPDPNVFGDYVPGSDGEPIEDQLLLVGEPNPEDTTVLTFEYNDELYLAFGSYVPVPEFMATQGTETGFNDDDTEIVISFTDPEDEENFYVFGFGNGEYVVIDDTFFNGQDYTFSHFTDQELFPGDTLPITVWGVDENFYNYLDQLIDQSDMTDNPLFQTPVATVRGNILKVEGIDNIETFDNVGRPQEFVLGYYAMVQERSLNLAIQ